MADGGEDNKKDPLGSSGDIGDDLGSGEIIFGDDEGEEFGPDDIDSGQVDEGGPFGRDDDGGGPPELTPGEVTFDTSEGEVFTAGDPRDPTVPPDRVGDAILEGDLVDRDPRNLDEPAIVGPGPADRAREQFDDPDEDAIRELLNTPELTGEEREELEALQREFEAANNQDFSGSFEGGGGGVRPDDTFPTRVEE